MNTHPNHAHALAGLAAVPLLGATGASVGALPILLIVLACPLMMFFMMRRMGGMSHGGTHDHDTQDHDTQDHDTQDHDTHDHDDAMPDRVPQDWTHDR